MPAIGFTGSSLGLSDDNNPENTPHTPTRQTTGENHRLFFINNLITIILVLKMKVSQVPTIAMAPLEKQDNQPE